MLNVHERYFHTVSRALPLWRTPAGKASIQCVHPLLTKRDERTAPALDAIQYEYQLLQGSFMEPSPYRGRPTPQMDALWERLWDWGAYNVPEHQLRALNKSESVPWHHVDEQFGGGLAGMSWGYHQLHCLVRTS